MGGLSDYDAAEIAALKAQWPEWEFWVVHGASRDWWCARRKTVATAELQAATPQHLRERIQIQLADEAIGARDAPDHI